MPSPETRDQIFLLFCFFYFFVLLTNRALFKCALRFSCPTPREQSKKRWDKEMKERGLSKDEAFMVETAAAAEIVSEHKNKKEKHKAAFGKIIPQFTVVLYKQNSNVCL